MKNTFVKAVGLNPGVLKKSFWMELGEKSNQTRCNLFRIRNFRKKVARFWFFTVFSAVPFVTGWSDDAGQAVWYNPSPSGLTAVSVPADYDGDGKADPAVAYDPGVVKRHGGYNGYGFFSMLEHNGRLYAGTYKLGVSNKVMVSENGSDWSDLLVDSRIGESVYEMLYYRGWIFAATEDDGRNGDGSGAKSGRVYVKRSSLSPRS